MRSLQLGNKVDAITIISRVNLSAVMVTQAIVKNTNKTRRAFLIAVNRSRTLLYTAVSVQPAAVAAFNARFSLSSLEVELSLRYATNACSSHIYMYVY